MLQQHVQQHAAGPAARPAAVRLPRRHGSSSAQHPAQHRSPTATAAAAVAAPMTAVHPALAAAEQVVQRQGGWFSPEVTDRPDLLIRQNVPFLTTQAGALPEKPRNLNHALWMYGR